MKDDAWRERLEASLSARGFRRLETPEFSACWVRKTWNTNRAVVVLEVEASQDPALAAKEARDRCASVVGYVPVLYGLGLQIVVVGAEVRTAPSEVVDRWDNQRCVLQAVHILPGQGKVVSASTWGQVISGSDQQAVAAALSPTEVAPMERNDAPSFMRYVPLLAGLGFLLLLFVRCAGP